MQVLSAILMHSGALNNSITRSTHAQWASHQVYASLMRPPQLCACMSTNDIPDHIHTYVRT